MEKVHSKAKVRTEKNTDYTDFRGEMYLCLSVQSVFGNKNYLCLSVQSVFEKKIVFVFGGRSLFLHHLVRKHLSALQGDAQRVGASRKALHANALQARGLAAHQAALQVEKFDPGGRYVGRVLQVEDVFGGIGPEAIRADADAVLLVNAVVVVVDDDNRDMAGIRHEVENRNRRPSEFAIRWHRVWGFAIPFYGCGFHGNRSFTAANVAVFSEKQGRILKL